MKRMSFRFIACVAIVLACVMLFEVPVSAVESVNLSNYLVRRYVSDGLSLSEYYYTVPSSCSISVQGLETITGSWEDLGTFTTSLAFAEITTTKSYYRLKFTFYPTQKDVRVPLVFTDTNSYNHSCSLKSIFSFQSSADVTGSAYLSAYLYEPDGYELLVSGKSYPVNLIANSYTDLIMLYDYHSGVTDFTRYNALAFYVSFTFNNVPVGTTLSLSLSESINDSLENGVLVTYKKTFAQEAPVFSQNLSSSTVSYLVGDSANPLAVNATVSDGGTITYQWYRSNSSSSSGNAISGATGKTYTPDTSAESDIYYYCIATSTLDGSKKTTKSNVAHVQVVRKPVQPVIYANLHSGTLEYYQGEASEDLFFGVYVPDGGTLTYQWYQGDAAYGEPSPISGATSAYYTPPTDATGNYYYYCKATNTKGTYTASIWSREGKIKVNPPPDPALPPVITTDLPTEPVTFKEGASASALRIEAASPDGGVLSYQWYQLIDGVGKAIAGETTAGFRPDTAEPGEYQYYCVVTNTVLNTKATATSATATIIIQPDRTDSLLDTIIGGVSDIIDGIKNLPQMILDGLKGLFVPDVWQIAAYRDKWMDLLSSRFGAVYEAVMLIDEFGQAISEQAAMGVVTFPEVSIDLAGTPWTFGGWDVKVVPDGFGGVIVVLKSAISIVCTMAFVNGLKHRFEGIMGGA